MEGADSHGNTVGGIVTYDGWYTSSLKVSLSLLSATSILYLNFSAPVCKRRSHLSKIREAIDFFMLLEETGKLEIFDVENQRQIYKQNHSTMPSV